MYELRKDGDRDLVRSWASDIEDGTMRQAERSARSPAVAGPIALMPDAHFGLGGPELQGHWLIGLRRRRAEAP